MYVADTISRAFLNETKEQILPDIEFNSFTYLLMSTVGLIRRTTYQNLLIFIWPFDEITCLDGLLFKGHKVIVSAILWKEMLNRIQSSHLRIIKCPICALNSKINSMETLMEFETTSRPWSIISAALFDFQRNSYLLCVDHFSKWPEFSKFENQTSGNTILHLTCTCSRYGIPKIHK